MHFYPASWSATLNHPHLKTIHLTVRQDEPLKMPEHPGSMLRGAFGTALRSLTCITDMPECKKCPLKHQCKFPRIFEMPALQSSSVQAVNPYVIHIPISQVSNPCAEQPHYTPHSHTTHKTSRPTQQATTYNKGDVWQFGMTLMGAAIAETQLIIDAWKLALETGLGTHAPYRRATLVQASCEGDTLYSLQRLPSNSENNTTILDKNLLSGAVHVAKKTKATDADCQLTMQFLTPFRYQQNNRIVSHPDHLDSITFIASLYNRIRLCQDNHNPNQAWDIGYDSYHHFKEDIESLTIAVDVAANHVPRRSNRQQRKMQLYGLQGDIHLSGDAHTIARLMPALRLGEKLHIGKNTTMGLGQYQLILMPTVS
ncbi:CRISPR system precrRNA processing endoribonuclease RAMP protein Cas6 [Psychrobacter sp. ANT_WB68]|uniref:CRISPR system precrRNA processing endoribonuclease RAMP protein Cas6 n=1 Tax=Psychrobacter sp. ANT_WB68 TaxID=2597355 RepID=UPI0011F2ABB7|nr:CRISPR system precrRNA processing endoribonuclease RAMP protein Cas6 [Psychrobacter sp. ANT_WB68]KAA0915608.1 CRISPR system precrRNA processing endoribonuclease RAMP protein Cas6 [Psychrobacter sp. ANT_WB68]